MELSISTKGVRHPTEALAADSRALLTTLGLENAELSIVLCDDPFIRRLNRQWRKKDRPTDVLSFSMREGTAIEGGAEVLGDLVISLDTARKQATEQGHTLETELRVLLVHGLLHLLGYDHEAEADASEMRTEEARLLSVLEAPALGLIRRVNGEDHPNQG